MIIIGDSVLCVCVCVTMSVCVCVCLYDALRFPARELFAAGESEFGAGLGVRDQ